MADEQELKGREEKAGTSGEIDGIDMAKIIGIISSVRHGSVTLIIQNGKVVQIEKNEKIRLV
jgi:hypothetical protein